MALSKKVRGNIIRTLTEAKQDNPTPLELGARLQDCFRKKLAWEPHTGELTKDFVYRVFDDETVKRLPLINFAGRKLMVVYKKPKSKKRESS